MNFLYCHEDDATGRATGRRMADTFNYLAAQLISAREAFPSRSYQSLGLLPQLRRQATGPDATEQAGEGLAFGGPAAGGRTRSSAGKRSASIVSTS